MTIILTEMSMGTSADDYIRCAATFKREVFHQVGLCTFWVDIRARRNPG